MRNKLPFDDEEFDFVRIHYLAFGIPETKVGYLVPRRRTYRSRLMAYSGMICTRFVPLAEKHRIYLIATPRKFAE